MANWDDDITDEGYTGYVPGTPATYEQTLFDVSGIVSTGFLVKNTSNSIVTREFTASEGAAISNGTGIDGNPNITISITGLDADASPDAAADYIMTYDASTGENKKVLIQDLPTSGGAVDSVNGQTGVVVLDTGDVSDSLNKRYVTDAQLTVIGNTSGTNTGDQDLSGLVPYTGATGDVTLGTHKLTGSAVQANSSAGGELRTNGGTVALHWASGGSANGTLYGGWNYDNATADTIASFGASKTLTSLALATYPSLTELSYVKGVTSAIQTQLSGKQATGNYITDLTGDVTATGGGSVAGTIANDAVTYAKMQNVSAASKLIGRGDGGSGDPQEITLGTNLSMSGTTLNAAGGGGLTTGQSLALARGMALN